MSWFIGRSGLVVPAVLIGLAIFLVVGLTQMDSVGDNELFGPAFFPTVTAVLCVVVAIALTVKLVIRPEPAELTGADGETLRTHSNWPAIAGAVATLALFGLILLPLGWIISGAVLFWGMVTALGNRRHAFNLLVGLAMSSVLQLVFSGWLGLTLPPGVMGWF